MPFTSHRHMPPTLLAHGRRLAAALFLACSVLPGIAQAGLPDATRFGVVMELGDVAQAREWLDEGLPVGFLADRVGSGLMIGAWEGNIPLMQLFLERGADINQTNGLGEQALQLAAWHGHLDAVKWLVDHGAQVNRQGDHWSALHYAAFGGQDAVVSYLLSRGADVNARAPNKSTVLMMAVHEDHEGIVKALLAAGADPQPKNDWGDSALTWAMRYHNLAIAKLVSSATEFAVAAKAPPETFGKDERSTAAPLEVSEVLRQIRIARSEGKDTAQLEQALFAMAASLQQQAARAAGRKKGAPGALVITARRGGKGAGGERAELSYENGRGRMADERTLAATSGASDVADILMRMRQAQTQGKPVDELRDQLLDAVVKASRKN